MTDRAARVAATFLAPVGCALPAHDTRIIDRDGWYQTITPSSGSSAGNEVAWSRVGAAEADAVVRRTIAEYAAHQVPFRWTVGPLTEPAGFDLLLARHGFVARELRGMAIEPARWAATVPDDVRVEPVTAANLDDYRHALVAGWGPDAAGRDPAAWRDQHLRALATGRFQFFVARAGDDVVGTAGTILKPDVAYLVGGNVLPAHRGRGVYRALLDARLRRVAAAGVPLAATHAAADTSAPILARLGFDDLCTVRVHAYAG